MIKIIAKRIYEIIKKILNGNKLISARNMRIFWVVSLVNTLIWIILLCNPYQHYSYELIISFFVIILFIYLPEIVILSLSFFIKKLKIEKLLLLKMLSILINCLSFSYFIILLLYTFFIIYFGSQDWGQ